MTIGACEIYIPTYRKEKMSDIYDEFERKAIALKWW
jgi:hypothetical protein